MKGRVMKIRIMTREKMSGIKEYKLQEKKLGIWCNIMLDNWNETYWTKNFNDIKLKYEVKSSKNKLEALLDVNVDYFAYPYGASYNQKRIKDIILDSGYRGAFTTFIGVNDKITNPVFMFRYLVDYTDKSGEQNKYIKAFVTTETEIIKFLHRKKLVYTQMIDGSLYLERKLKHKIY